MHIDTLLHIPGFETQYAVTQDGRVWSCRTGRFLSRFTRNGYPAVNLSVNRKRSQKYVHDLVLLTFAGPRPQGMEACHCDGNRANCAITNLRWDTPAGNQADKLIHGTHGRGMRNPAAVLTEAQVRAIRALRGAITCRDLAKGLGVSFATISHIWSGRTWKHLT